MKRFSPLFLAGLLVAALGSPGFAELPTLDTPTLSCGESTGASIEVIVTAGATGAFAGVSIHYTTLADYEENGWSGAICALSLSGMPSRNHPGASRWDLGPNESTTIVIGDVNFDETGVSGNECSMEPLECSQTYVFRVFAHAGRDANGDNWKRSAFSDVAGDDPYDGVDDPLICSTNDCAGPGEACTYTQGFWKTHGPEGCLKGNNTNEWPSSIQAGGMDLGSVHYTEDQLCSILNQPAQGNGLVFLAHQLIAAKLNVANNVDEVCADVAMDIADADVLIGALVVPPVGAGYLKPSDASPLNNSLTSFNEGNECGWGHCGDEDDPCTEDPPCVDDNETEYISSPLPVNGGGLPGNVVLGVIRDEFSGNPDYSNPWCNNRTPMNAAGYFCYGSNAQDCNRNFLWDPDTAPSDGVPEYGLFRMMVFDFGEPKRGMRLVTAIDHWNGDPASFINGCCGYDADFVTQDVMEYSIWGYIGPDCTPGPPTAEDATNMANWRLLSDVVGWDHTNTIADGHPTYLFDGQNGPAAAAPVRVWTAGSGSCGVADAYSRDYVFCRPYQYVGVRSSAISKNDDISWGGGKYGDADPELDAVWGFDPPDPGQVIYAESLGGDTPKRPELRKGRVTVYGLAPNPFSGSTRLDYTISGTAMAPVQIDVFSVSGRLVRTLEAGSLAPGQHSVTWNGRDAGGAQAVPGVYFIRASVDRESVTSRVLLLK